LLDSFGNCSPVLEAVVAAAGAVDGAGEEVASVAAVVEPGVHAKVELASGHQYYY